MLTAINGSPQPSTRKYVWEQLEALERGMPWMLIGNFNCVLMDEERSSKSGASTLFKNWVRDNGMSDMGFVGNQCTWRHGTNTETRRVASLDKAICCDD